ncbi:hypothetical protein FACS1894142_3190 [Spirochaetia bacterium]|nr:hypothetical protein FACS1894142_3190 [Spirochaetia bacterium]
MPKNFVFILTEGSHDAAFIYRILKANGLKTNHSIIKDYPAPLNELFKAGLYSVPIEDLNIEAARSRFLPCYVMQKDENAILSIYVMGGESKKEKRNEFVKTINAFTDSDTDAIQTIPGISISVLFFFDADDKGIGWRISQIKDELKFSLPDVDNADIDKIANKEIISTGNINVGIFVFTDKGKDTGLLEDILIPMMMQENEDIFGKAEDFLGIHREAALFRDNVEYDSTGKTKKVFGEKYYHKKSLIGTVGQLQLSGKSNVVCINDAAYLTDKKIKSNDTCVDIFLFVMKAMEQEE